jgi:hypothetical protein
MTASGANVLVFSSVILESWREIAKARESRDHVMALGMSGMADRQVSG